MGWEYHDVIFALVFGRLKHIWRMIHQPVDLGYEIQMSIIPWLNPDQKLVN